MITLVGPYICITLAIYICGQNYDSFLPLPRNAESSVMTQYIEKCRNTKVGHKSIMSHQWLCWYQWWVTSDDIKKKEGRNCFHTLSEILTTTTTVEGPNEAELQTDLKLSEWRTLIVCHQWRYTLICKLTDSLKCVQLALLRAPKTLPNLILVSIGYSYSYRRKCHYYRWEV